MHTHPSKDSATTTSIAHTLSAFDLPAKLRAVLTTAVVALSLSACQSGSVGTPTVAVQSDSTVNVGASADLSADSLLPPTPIAFTLSSKQGTLSLNWDPIVDQQISRIYQYDVLEDVEILIHSSNNESQATHDIASQSHQRAWHRELFRIELCDSENCFSSTRQSIKDLVEPTAQRLTPAVFNSGERFAENFALNNDARVLAAALPHEGAVDMYIKPSLTWESTQRIRLNALATSNTRKFFMDLSAEGNTLAVFIRHHNGIDTSEIRIIERLGEGWFETNRIALDEVSDAENVNVSSSIILSDDGNKLLFSAGEQLYTSNQVLTNWSSPTPLLHATIEDLGADFNSRFAANASLKALSASNNLDRIFAVHVVDQSLWINVWQQDSADVTNWTNITAYPLNALDPTKDVLMHSHASGEQLMLAGWEAIDNEQNTPVAWRYQLPLITDNQSTTSSSLLTLDSIRFPSTQDASAQLRFSADNSLSRILLGWQGNDAVSVAPDAALITYEYSELAMRWIPKLELPEVFPTFAKQAFVHSSKLSADGNALMIGIAAGQSLSDNNRVGEILTLH